MFERSLTKSSVAGAAPLHLLVISALMLTVAACSSTKVETEDMKWDAAQLPKPDQLVVFDFATSADEVELNHGLIADVRDLVDTEPRAREEKAVGKSVSNAVSEKLVEQLREKGLPAVRAKNVIDPGVRPIQVKGQILSIDEGNRARRILIGLGAGRSSVEARVQLYESIKGRAELLEEMQTWTKSGRKPGMAETMGVGALAGHIIISGLAGGGLSVASEKLSADADALADNMAKKVALEIEEYYQKRGWR